MTRPAPRRSGITLTEILISILIMGVGMISIATLFPIGLLRIREAQRASRSGLLARSVFSDVEGRALFTKTSFLFTWYSGTDPIDGTATTFFDPWVQDLPLGAPIPPVTNAQLGGVYRGYGAYGPASGVPYVSGPGLPVAYDPLWWSMIMENSLASSPPTPAQRPTTVTGINGRFGATNGSIRGDQGPLGIATPSAYGLQRLTNFYSAQSTLMGWNPSTSTRTLPLLPIDPTIFVSQEDLMLQSEGGMTTPPVGTSVANASPLVPDLSGGAPVYDWAYSWMFTGQQSDANDHTVFDGNIVVFHNRAFGLDTSPYAAGVLVPAGERTVEAVFGYSTTLRPFPIPFPNSGYGSGDARLVLLRWPNTQPDPEIAVGSWLADVTYERVKGVSDAKFGPQEYPGQRCYWYQVARRTAPDVDPDVANYRRLIVTLASRVRAKTLLVNDNLGTPYFTNVALLCPTVVNVFPKVFYTR